MSRLLWLSNAPWGASGYGEQTALFVPRLRELGHEVAVLCNFGLQGRETRWDGITCYPSDGYWGNFNLSTFADLHRADQVIALCDAWVLNPESWREGLELALWAPVDHWPIPPKVLGTLSQKERVRPLAMSRFGHEQMTTFDLDAIYIPHGVDTKMFRPQPEIKDEVRDELGIPRDVFLVGMVGANVGNRSLPRKAFPQAILAFSEFARRHDDAWFYIHTQAKPMQSGLQLDRLCEVARCPAGRVRFPHEEAFQIGMPRQALAYTYAAFDVLLMPSMGEGFGVPLIEAQACGIPVITSDHSSMTELCGAGWLVGGEPWWDELQESFFIVPSIAQIVAALEQAYDHVDDPELQGRAVAFAGDYDADLVADRYWRPALDELLGVREEAVA